MNSKQNPIHLFGYGFLAASLTAGGLYFAPLLNHAQAQNPPAATAPIQAPVQSSANFDPNLFVSLAERTVPSVVNISTLTIEHDVPSEFPFPWRGFSPSAPRSGALGTGFVIAAKNGSGIILTNQHVVAKADEIKISFTESPEEKPTPGKVIARDPELDVALIEVKTDRKLTPLPLGDSENLKVGEYVAAVGNPFGQGHSFTHGIVSAKGRNSPQVPLATYIQTDAPINPGNSGGPLINLRGEVVGINNAIDARAQGIGFAIPINVVKKILPELESKGKIARGYIGVMVSDLTPETAKKLGAAEDLRAPMVVQVTLGGPAFKAGVRPYDVITEFNGKPIRSASELTTEVTALPEGTSVPIKVSRADRTLELKIKLTKRPAAEEQS